MPGVPLLLRREGAPGQGFPGDSNSTKERLPSIFTGRLAAASAALVALKQAPFLIRPALMKKALFLFFSLLIVISVFGDFAPPAAAKAVDL